MSFFSLKVGQFLYDYVYPIYQPLYFAYKRYSEKFEIELLRKNIQRGNNVVDIGANIGFYTRILADIVGENGKVVAFEPDKINFQKLKDNTKHLKNVVLENMAVANHTGNIKLYFSELNVDHRTYPISDTSRCVEIPCVRLDDYFTKNGFIDFIKIDIQGFEPFAFEGMKNIIQQNRKIKLLSEFWPYGLTKAGSSAEKYYSELKDYFSKVYLIKDKNLIELTTDILKELPVSEQQYFNVFCTND
ncbi:MAG: hypothetical protein KatS3mg027_2395 [Bacteroidia bacterium]|nr:MAG: hypothetical protein KatS3mg027_2395 [Bacteroidia bacterium]